MSRSDDRPRDDEQHDIADLQNGDQVTVELTGTVVDQMERHDGLVRIDNGQKIEIVADEIVSVEKPARAVDIEEVDDAN